MAYSDVINDFSNGASGTVTDVNGDVVGYTVSGTSPNTNWMSLVGGARVNGDGTQSFTLTFDEPVVGAAMRFSGSDASEPYYIEVNGSTVDLNFLIANGDVTFTQSGAATHVIRPDGGLNGGHHSDGSIADFVFNFPVTSLGAYGSGTNSGNWDFVEVGIDDSTFDVVCFTKGTRLETISGNVKVEDLNTGDVLQTFIGTSALVRWIGYREISKSVLVRNEKLLPVRIRKGALGNGLPNNDVSVSRQHRVMVSSRIAERVFGVANVLVPAIKLVGFPGISIDQNIDSVTYFHILCDEHIVLKAEGAPFESLLIGEQATKILEDGSIHLHNMGVPADLLAKSQTSALTIASGPKLRKLLARHKKNDQPFLQRQNSACMVKDAA